MESSEDKKRKRYLSLLKEIGEKYPELFAERPGKEDRRPIEVITAYYQLKSIEAQEKREWIMIALTLSSLILAATSAYFVLFKN